MLPGQAAIPKLRMPLDLRPLCCWLLAATAFSTKEEKEMLSRPLLPLVLLCWCVANKRRKRNKGEEVKADGINKRRRWWFSLMHPTKGKYLRALIL